MSLTTKQLVNFLEKFSNVRIEELSYIVSLNDLIQSVPDLNRLENVKKIKIRLTDFINN